MSRIFVAEIMKQIHSMQVLIAAGMTSPALRDAAMQGAASRGLAGHGEDNKSC